MKTQFLAAALAVASVALSGCATGAKLSPEQAQAMADAFHKAGCGGRFDLDAGAATGQLGGAAHVQLGLHGECPIGRQVVEPTANPAAPVTGGLVSPIR